ncbi:DUF1367 family protein [Vibrio parahaemolyticus]|nr:DUF1367 family protein [Vibrio alginolyticus]EHR5466313.1 DUF1367 family protein [Vibrio parahaemolyticus]EJB8408317.1 DUF1367 family protein [Vibrio parahaemolyticus]ELA9712779.1 DUF1367 family protein [Vibrio parahaemolyticus]ELA9726287.1 DUF1367 family protein [Vibrio parahaemolyticus]
MQTVRAKKEKLEIFGYIGTGGYIQYADSDMREKAATMSGRVVAIKPKSKAKSRILEHHRKFFALINLGFEYWSPDVSLISEPEFYIAHETAKQFCQLAGRSDMYETHGIEIANMVLSKIKKQRESHCDPEAYKCKDNYRYQVMIDAGFFDLEILPNGGTVKRPWSIAFDNADQEQFEKIYKGCFDVIWNKSLFQVFNDEQEMQNAVFRFMEYA